MITGQTVVALTAQPTLGENEILADKDTGMPVYAWSRDTTIVNKVDVSFDYNDPALVQENSARRQVYNAVKSRNRYHAQAPQPSEFRGVRTAHSGATLMDDYALIYFQRHGYPPPRMRAPLTYNQHVLESGDRILVTHPLIENPIDGTLGLDREPFEIIDISPFFLENGRLDGEFLWVGAIETSPVPTATLVNLVPGINTIDGTDAPIPLGGSVTVTTAASVVSFRIGLKRRAYRQWQCVFNVQALEPPPAENPVCVPAGTVAVRKSFTGSATYRMEYKTSGAPDAPGSGSDPTTGWVQLLASKTRGSVTEFSDGGCGGGSPSLPGEDFFAEFFETLGASPNTYNVKVFWTAAGSQADPCSGYDPNSCNPDIFCPGTASHNSSVLEADHQTVTLDFVESIT